MKFAHHIAHLLFPRESNNHKAKILHSSFIVLLSVLIISFQLFLNVAQKGEGGVLGYASNISVDEVIRLTNEKRAASGLPPVVRNENLTRAASSKGAHMLENDYWAHVAPDGTQPWKFFADVGYKYKYAGENLARDFSNPSSAVEAWMASPTHKENMLSAKYKEIGVAVVEGDLSGSDTTLIVQLFGTTLIDSAPVAPVAQAKESSEAAVKKEQTAGFALAKAPEQIVEQRKQEEQKEQVLVSPFNITKGLSTALVVLLVFVLVADVIVVSRRRISRVSGRPLAHLAFMGMILVIILLSQAGKIL